MWKDLTMAQKSELMKIFIKSGITSTSEMASIYDKNHSASYNSFAAGGIKDPPEKPIIAGTTPDSMEAQNFVANNNIDLTSIPRREKIWADYAEPWVGGADLIATGLRVYPYTAAVGKPLKALTTAASLAVDAAQTKEALKNEEYGSAAINGGEMTLTLVGGKLIGKGVNTALIVKL